jgi:hypothetical protein
MRTPGWKTVLWFFLEIGCWIAGGGMANAEVRHLSGQTLYVPAYSHIYHGDRERPMLLTVTLSVRNTDLSAPIFLQSVEYYDSNGKRVSSMIQEPVSLGPLSSSRFVIKESDATGGSGACFVVRWKSAKPVTEPVVESIMINTQSQLGISFTSPARVLEETIVR